MLRIITPPDDNPVSLAEAKAHLRVNTSTEDDLIMGMIKSATLQAQALTQRLFVTQTVEWILPAWPAVIRLPIAPVKASDGISSIKYYDESDVQQTLAAANYVARQIGPTACIFPKFDTTWPTISATPVAEPIVIRFTAGQVLAASPEIDIVPENVRSAIKLLVAHYYENREASVANSLAELPLGVSALLMPEVWD